MIKRESRPVRLGNPDKDGWSPIIDDKTGKTLDYFNPNIRNAIENSI